MICDRRASQGPRKLHLKHFKMPNPSELCTTLRMAVLDKMAHNAATDVHACGEAGEAGLRVKTSTPAYSFPKSDRDGLRGSKW